MATKLCTCLWFDGAAEEAARFYVELISGSEIGEATRAAPDGPALVVDFTLGGAPFQAFNGAGAPALSPAASIVVRTEDQDETDRLWSALTADGGAPGRCGWLTDRFGVSWQIVPKELSALLAADDPAAAARVVGALSAMDKIDVAALGAARAGG